MGTLRILVGNIVSEKILVGHDLIVNPTNPYMIAGSGVSGAIFNKAGKERLEKYTKEKYKIDLSFVSNCPNIMKTGEVRITPGFDLGMDIMFVQGPKFYEHKDPLSVLSNVYSLMLNEIKNKSYKNVLMPSLGTGTYGYKHENVGKMVYSLLNSFTETNEINIDLILTNENLVKYYN